MPFISKDWRDPGKLWIKTDRGWEEKMVIEQMQMISDSEAGCDDLLAAMHDALAAAVEREALAAQFLQDNPTPQQDDQEKRALLDNTYWELKKARERKSYIEWELCKRKFLNLDRMEAEGERNCIISSHQNRHDNIVQQPFDAYHSDEKENISHIENRVLHSSVGEDILVLKINVKDRVQYIEKNKCLIKDFSLQDMKQKPSSNIVDTFHKNVDHVKDEEEKCIFKGTKRAFQQQSDSTFESCVVDQSTGARSERGKPREEVTNKDLLENVQDHTGSNLVSTQRALVLPDPPHCHITVKNTREISGFNRLCEVLKRLDFRGAVWDQQRFLYICKLIELLTTRRLRTLTGGSQKMLLVLLEELARSVRARQQHQAVVRRLVLLLQERLCHCILWGKQLGSQPLWTDNTSRLNLIQAIITTSDIQTSVAARPCLQDLPEECVRAVLLRLNHHTDLQRCGEAYSVMGRIVQEQNLWRRLCCFHWTEQQIQSLEQQHPALLRPPVDWSKVYTRLKRSFGLREEFAVSLVLCRACHCLFWANLGHPCLAEQDPALREKIRNNSNSHSDMLVTIPPQTFLSFFS